MRFTALTLILGACGSGHTSDGVADGGAPDRAIDALGTIGSACVREADCADGLACRVERIDDGDGFPEDVELACGVENAGGSAIGDACASHDACLTGLCQFGRCSEVCTPDSCPAGFACNDVSSANGGVFGPALECPAAARAAARLAACLPERGAIDVALASTPIGSWVAFDVPSLAASMTIVAETDVPDAFVGVWALLDPLGDSLYAFPLTPEEFFAQPIRYYPGDRISAMQVPNTPDVTFSPGVHCFQLVATAGVEVASQVRLKMTPDGVADGGSLALDVHFLDLSGMGCGVDGLDSSAAATHALWLDALDDIDDILGQAGIAVGAVSTHDLPGRPDLDVIDYLDGPDGDGIFEELNALFSAGEGASGDTLDVFLVRGIQGKSGISGAIPGPPGIHALPHAGVAIGMDAVCDTPLGQLIAHEVGHQLGLFHNIDAGDGDPIADTDEGTENLMHPSTSGAELTAGQAFVLRANPLVR